MKVGELARRSRISVRTLHHYDEIGLLSPSKHSDSGHRIYSEQDVQRLQQIVSLKALGMSLAEISKFFQNRHVSPISVIEMHLDKLQKEMSELQNMSARLTKIGETLKSRKEPTVDELLQLPEAINMFEKYYSENNLSKLADRTKTLGTEQMHAYEQEWSDLILSVKEEIHKGASITSPTVQDCARQWLRLMDVFTGGDKSIAQSLGQMYKQEGAEKASRGAIDHQVFGFMAQAVKHLQTTDR